MRHALRTSAALVVGAALVLFSTPIEIRGQSAAGYRASWGDLETWTRLIEASRENEVGLGLQTSGPGGVMFVAFTARLDTRDPTTPPQEVTVQAGTPPRTSPNAIHSATLSFIADDRTDRRTVIDLTPRLTVDNPAPGAEIHDGTARMRVADFTRLLAADTLKASVFGLDVNIRPDQLTAIREFAGRVHLLPKQAP